MGCCSSKNPSPAAAAPEPKAEEKHLTWSRRLMSSGGDKDIYAGKYKGNNVAVCVAKPQQGGRRRIENEIEIFKKLGNHPHIIHMYHSGRAGAASFMVLEIVEPIGYDLDRLKNMYSFAGQTVPSSLMARIFRQLISALMHMHKKSIIHRDLKTENVLVDSKHNAKLIDMGIACKVGTRDTLRAGYLAPELCEGIRPLGVEVDSWGLGLILHQIYRHQWKVLSDTGPVRMLYTYRKPSEGGSMENLVWEAMVNLLKFKPSERWTMKQLEDSKWLKKTVTQAPDATNDWQKPVAAEDRECQYLRRYTSVKPLPTALAVFISRKNHAHLIGKQINALSLGNVGITVLLINYGNSTFERMPGADTIIKENSWFYFGVPQTDGEMQKAVKGLSEVLTEDRQRSEHLQRNFRALSRQEVIETGKLVEFTIEFDCFSFPNHIGAEAMIGAPKNGGKVSKEGEKRLQALNLRRIFKINLVGIQRLGDTDPQWFPGASSTVSPDDLGLVMREPCKDGSTKSTLADEDLEALMNEELFVQQMKQCPE